MNTTTLQQEKAAQLLWTAFILSFFVIQAIIWTIAISITSSDTSHAVVAGYDEQALNWDEVKQQRLASVELGWQAEIQVDASGDIYGNRVVTVELSSKSHEPVTKASISLVAYHRGRAAEKQSIELNSVATGVYSGKVVVDRDGLWQFTGSARKAEQQFLIDQRIYLSRNKGGQ